MSTLYDHCRGLDVSGNMTDPSFGLPKLAPGPLLDLRRQILQSGGLSASATIEILQSDQLERWRRGERIPAESYLHLWAELPASGLCPDSEEFCDLIYAEVLLRRELGENPALSEYLFRFPQFSGQLSLVAELEEYVDSGLTAEDHISTFSDKADPAQAAESTRWPRVAGYKISGELGRGGMGIVYKARQIALQRLVALKVIRTGEEADAATLARFRVEAEAVADLQHPNIVQIYEIGGLDGAPGSCPFMALELVPGGSLASAMASGEWRAVGKEGQARAVTLVATIARAIHHAHQRGILHRDLKPGNILLQRSQVRSQKPVRTQELARLSDHCPPTSDLCPKITDFGLAKRLEEGSGANTRTGSMLGTPSYMAPEQAAGLHREVGVATDVYALGAILYELLTGRPPFKGETPLETMLLVRAAEPVPPRRLRPKLPVDLETICLKCLAKDAQKRYASARHLVDDLERFLAREPILARPVSRLERCLKWARRRPAASSLICVSAIAALTVLVVVLVSNSRLEHQRDETEQRREEAEEQRLLAVSHLGKARMAVDRMLTRVAHDLKYIPQMDPVRNQLLADALELYQELARDADADLELRSEIASAFHRLGDISDWMGQTAKADYCYKEAIAIQRQLRTTYPAERNYRRALGQSYRSLSASQQRSKQLKEAEESLERAFEIQEELCREFPDEADYLGDLAKSYNTQGNLISAQKSPKESERSYRTAIKHLEELASRFPFQSTYVFAVLTSRSNLAVSMAEDRRYSEAEGQYRLNLKVCEDALKREPANLEYLSKLALTCANLGATLADLGRYSEAMAVWNRCVEIDEKLLADQRESPARSYALADLLFDMGQAALKNARPAEARQLLERALAHSGTAVKLAPARKDMVSLHCNSCAALAQTLLQLKEHSEAARVAVELCSLCPDTAAELARAAGMLAQCVPLAEQDPQSTPDQRRETGRQYGDRAASLLRKAVVKGYRDIDFLQHDRSLDALRKRADFQQILLDLQKGAK